MAMLMAIGSGAAFLWYIERPPAPFPEPTIIDRQGTTSVLASPSRLVIPKIGVDASIQHVGIGESGNMAVPTNYEDVGWYRLGFAPGERGSAVIAGHLDNGYGLPAVFKHLDMLAPGDTIVVYDASGAAARFEVEQLTTYDAKDAPVADVFAADDGVRLNLITCDGTWNPLEETYSKRLVVFAKAVSSL